MRIKRMLESLQSTFPDTPLSVETWPGDETVVTLALEHTHGAVEMLIERFGLHHLSTITGEDSGDDIVLLYHFWDGRGLTLRTTLPREGPHIRTLTDLVPGALFYEREVSEMFGVEFEGHPGVASLLLPDDWDSGPPLRKEAQ